MQRYPHQLSGGMQQRVGDRHGAGQRSDAADPRRADHRPRCHGRGRGARPHRAAAARVRASILFISHNLAVVAKHVRPGRRALCRHAGRGRADRSACSTIRAIPTRWRCCAACRGGGQRKDQGRLDTIPGFLPGARRRHQPAAPSPSAARWPTSAAARELPPLYRSRRPAVALPLSRTRRRRCRARRRADVRGAGAHSGRGAGAARRRI